MYDHGFRLDQDEINQGALEEPHWLSLLEVFRKLVFPHCDCNDPMIMVCTRKWLGRLEFTYMFYPGKEYFYIAWKDKELWRKERDV